MRDLTDELVVRHCAPTLAGLKTGSLFRCACDNVELFRNRLRLLNGRLSPKGVRLLPLRTDRDSALVYVYRPQRLKADVVDRNAARMLTQKGYRCSDPNRCVLRLIERLRDKQTFPHEIGLFLGYPPEDVRGFIENGAGSFRCSGCWKVYGNEAEAKRLFARYRKCTDDCLRLLKNGRPIERLTADDSKSAGRKRKSRAQDPEADEEEKGLPRSSAR